MRERKEAEEEDNKDEVKRGVKKRGEEEWSREGRGVESDEEEMGMKSEKEWSREEWGGGRRAEGRRRVEREEMRQE